MACECCLEFPEFAGTGARENQMEPDGARDSQNRARESQHRAKESQGEPVRARESQGEH